jgi:hypothetical protein
VRRIYFRFSKERKEKEKRKRGERTAARYRVSATGEKSGNEKAYSETREAYRECIKYFNRREKGEKRVSGDGNMGRQVESTNTAMICVSEVAAQTTKLKYKMALLRVNQFHRERLTVPRVLDSNSIGSAGTGSRVVEPPRTRIDYTRRRLVSKTLAKFEL